MCTHEAMKPAELERWMKENDKTAVDIASALKMHPSTISNYIKGSSVRRSTVAAFETYVATFPKNKNETTRLKHTG